MCGITIKPSLAGRLAAMAGLLAAVAATWFAAAIASGQEAAAAPAATPAAPATPLTFDELRKRAPYDLITTDKAFNNAVYQVKPIEFPGGRVVPAEPKPSDKLKVFVILEEKEAEIEWHNIDRIDLYEEIVLGEANQLVAAGKLDDAFDYFRFLLTDYPGTRGLPAAHQNYLYQCIADARKRDAYPEALAIAEELYQRNASFKAAENSPPFVEEIGQIADRIISAYIQKEDFRSAKTLLKRLESRLGAAATFVRTWRKNLSDIAARHRDASRQHLAAKRFVEAYDECAAMINIWPEVEGGADLAAEITRLYPLAVVGVAQPALTHDARSLADPAARRTGRLVERRLMEFAGLGPEGGAYQCALGATQLSDDRLRLTFQLKSPAASAGSGPSGFDVARHLLDLADPASARYQPQWGRLLDHVEVRRVGFVDADLKVPHVLPQAFLQIDYDPAANLEAGGVKGSGPYYVLSKTEKVTRFTQNDRYPLFTPGQPAEIMERFYDDSKRGILALQRGEVDVLDQVFPGDVPELKANKEITVGRYSVPTIHFLTVVRRNPYLANRTFRRALVYGCDRQAILTKGLLKGTDLPPGYREISAPFPAPTSAGDSTTYGYDETIPPRPFNPWLALVLKAVSANDLKSQFEKQLKQAPVLAPLTLGHPADEISRIACRALVRQWKAIGIEVKLVEFPPGVVSDLNDACDLVYTQAATWEPVVDAGRLLAPDGLTPADNTYVSLMLRRVESAKDWVEARQALRDLHRQLHEDVTVIPLWQTFDYYAWRSSVQGLKDGQATLYETVDQWKVAPRLEAR